MIMSIYVRGDYKYLLEHEIKLHETTTTIRSTEK
jgi:hypothetical protein